jgi:hypothetical protein
MPAIRTTVMTAPVAASPEQLNVTVVAVADATFASATNIHSLSAFVLFVAVAAIDQPRLVPLFVIDPTAAVAVAMTNTTSKSPAAGVKLPLS